MEEGGLVTKQCTVRLLDILGVLWEDKIVGIPLEDITWESWQTFRGNNSTTQFNTQELTYIFLEFGVFLSSSSNCDGNRWRFNHFDLMLSIYLFRGSPHK